MNIWVPKKIFFTKGVGNHKEELHSFELALRNAGRVFSACSVAIPRWATISNRAIILL